VLGFAALKPTYLKVLSYKKSASSLTGCAFLFIRYTND